MKTIGCLLSTSEGTNNDASEGSTAERNEKKIKRCYDHFCDVEVDTTLRFPGFYPPIESVSVVPSAKYSVCGSRVEFFFPLVDSHDLMGRSLMIPKDGGCTPDNMHPLMGR